MSEDRKLEVELSELDQQYLEELCARTGFEPAQIMKVALLMFHNELCRKGPANNLSLGPLSVQPPTVPFNPAPFPVNPPTWPYDRWVICDWDSAKANTASCIQPPLIFSNNNGE